MGDGQQLVSSVGGGASTWDYQNSAGVLTDGTRSYLKDSTENLGLGISSGMLGKLHAKTDVVADICKIVTESDQGPAALHVRADTQGTQGGTGYGNIQIWNGGAPKVNIHYSPGTDEAIITADGTSNAQKGICLKANGVSGQNLGNQKLGSNSFGQVADIPNITGNDGNPMQTDVNAGTTVNITSGNGDLLAKVAPGDMVSVNAGTNYAHVISVVSNAQMTISSPLGVGGAQNMKVQKSIFDARLDGGTVAMLLDATAQLGVGAGRMDPEGSLHVSDTNEAKAIVDSMGKNARLELRADSQTGTATGTDRDSSITFLEGTAQAEKGRITYSADDNELWLIADGRPLPTNGLILDNEGSLKARRIKQGDTIATLLGTDGVAATTTATAGTNFFSAVNCSANFDYEAVSEGDKIALSSAPTVFETVTSAGSTSFITDGGLGDGTSQTIKLEKCILSFVDESGGPKVVVSPEGRLGVGTMSPDAELTVRTPLGGGNCSIKVFSPDDQAIVSLKADRTGVATGNNRNPSVNFQSGAGSGEAARIRYTKDHEQLEISLEDTPTVNDKLTMTTTPTGARVGVRQERGASGLSAKKLQDGQLLDSAGVAIQAQTNFSLTTHTIIGANDPLQLLAVGDLVAVGPTLPVPSDYAEIMGVGSNFFTTGDQIGVSGSTTDIWIKPAHFRLEDPTTTEDAFIVDGVGNARLGSWETGLDAKLTVKGDVVLKTFDTATEPAASDSARIYYRGTDGGNDDKMRSICCISI